jgi:cellulose synthase (UDP-forming)
VGWTILALLLAVVVMQPTGIAAQMIFGLCAMAIMLAIHLLKLKGVARHIFIAAGCAVAFRYLYWRITSTLPQPDDLMSFIPGMILLVAEVFSIGMLFLSAIVTSDPVKRKPVTLSGKPEDYPTVDVMIPSYNEDDDILFTTVSAAKNLDYPTQRLNIYLLDDGGTDQKCNSDDADEREAALQRRERLQEFCKELGVHYITREKNEMAKAGNLNNGMAHSTGEFIVVLDADHAPVREFLTKTIGYLQEDKSLFLVQTPHFFLNADPVEKNLNVFNQMPSENEMFYTVTQKGLDKWDASFFCGSAAVLRRQALDEVNGFSGMSITEDCETALELHSRGWSSAYVDEPMIAGFQPETVSSFLTQRSRWCQGMLQILLLKSPMFKRGLRPMQRMAYMSSMMFWLFPMSRLVFVFSPALYIFFNLEIYNATFQEFIVYTSVTMFTSALFQNYLFGTVRWPWISETYEYLQSLTLVRTIFSTLISPKKPTFKVTDKGTSLDEDFFSPHGWAFLISLIFLVATSLFGVYRLHLENYANELLLVVTFWAFFNAILGGLALGVCAERRERRRHYRISSSKHGLSGVLKCGDEQIPVTLNDMAIGGMSLKLPKGKKLPELADDDTISLELLKENDQASVHELPIVLKWQNSISGRQNIGVGFDKVSAKDRRFIAYLMFPNNLQIENIRQGRKTYRSIILGTLMIVKWSFQQTARGIQLALAGAFKSEPKGNQA